MLAVVAVGPAVEGAGRDRGHVIGHQIVADLVALVDRGPEHAALGIPGQTHRVAQAAGVDAGRARHPVDLEDGGAVDLLGHAEVGDVGVGADPNVEPGSIRAGDQALGPVVISARRQVGQLGRGRGDARLSRLIGHADHRIGVGDVEPVADQGHAEGRHQAGQEVGLDLGHPVSVGVAQQDQPVGAGGDRAGLLHDQRLEEALDALILLGRFGRGVGLGHQDVAIGQAIEPSWVVEARGEGLNPQALGRDRGCARRPAHGRGDLHGREQGSLRGRQGGLRAEAGGGLERLLPPAGGCAEDGDGGGGEEEGACSHVTISVS